MIMQPGFFEYGSTPVFASATRTHDIHFPYPWAEEDTVDLQLPAGYELDSADSPGDVADPRRIASLKTTIGIDRKTNVLKYKRVFHFGGGGNTLFPASSYEPLKALFDAFNKADTHALTLKQTPKP